ncbi:MAG: toxin, partial [Planctomycetaceae bacterium]|nr:toxin [Planctomycetaceae bacterium]
MQHSSVGGIDERRADSHSAKLSGENQRGDNFAASAPSISMPKGGGAIRGMGEKFAANPVTGTGSLSVPVPVSPGRQGFGPQLSLSYDSGAGNGPFGFGWNLSIPSITRKTDKGLPQYRDADESDVFILSGAEDLVPILIEVGGQWRREALPPRTVDGQEYQVQRYRPRIEGLFARIERWTNRQSGETHWRSISKDNITTLYGKLHDPRDATRGAQPRIADPTDSSRVFSWHICESFDDRGNWIVYQYAAENSDEVDESQAHERNRGGSRGANRYIKRILYGNQESRLLQSDQQQAKWLFEVVFDYGEHADNTPRPPVTQKWLPRTDSFSSFRAGFEVRTYRLCQRVLMFHHIPDGPGGHASNPGYDGLVRSTDFTYEVNDTTTYNFLKQVTQVAYRRHDHDDGYETKTLPPVDFQYSPISIDSEVQAVDAESLENLPYGLDGSRYQWVDLDGEGLSGILTKQAEGWFYKRNISPSTREPRDGKTTTQARFQPLQFVAQRPSLATLEPGGHQFLDLAGDGQLDLVQFARPLAGFYERTDESGWENFTPFESLPNIDWSDSNLRFVDLTGDGHADVLLTEDGAFTWHPSLGEDGFGPAERVGQAIDEERGPRLVFADGTQSIYLADMSGDGLNDLVRVRNGEVCYWPNLGYGRFGTKVTMGGSLWFDHPEMFDQRRVRLADIDGSGTTDIIYLNGNRVDLYFNQCGNSFSLPTPLASFPRIDNLSFVQTADLLGTGTACLVWSSPLPGDTRSQMRYVNLIGEQKPHLLTRVINNLGAETVIHYAPSTRFYLEDEFAGQPWITRLPFPVHVVERVETLDRISRNRFVTRYRYHHGYFDGEEREFRGFGMVEQFDTEELSVLAEVDVDFRIENSDPGTHVPPIHIKTWFHTGVYIDGEKISRHLAHEYFGAPKTENEAEWKKFEARLLPDTILPADADLTAHEEREACRALKGSILRQEVYALDESTKAGLPYSVSERNYTLEVMQPRGKNPHAVFFSHPCETIDYHYERNLDDPRIGHSFVLKVDQFGNVERSAAIGYGRAPANVTLTDLDDRTKQITTLATVEEHDFTKAIDLADAWRTPLPCEAHSFELTGPAVRAATGANRFTFKTIEDLIGGAFAIPYEQATGPIKDEKRLIEHVRTVYRSDDLTKLLPLGEIKPLALPGESYKLALTPNLVTRIFETRVANPLLIEGKYVHTKDRDGVEDANWWIPSGRIFYHPTASDNAAELDEARKHFFLPRRTRDPFGFESFVDYDTPNDLVAIHTKDAIGNETSAEIDYRVLQSKLVTDPNGNQVAASFDILGLVAGTAVIGRNGEGDSLTDFKPELTDDQRTVFFNKPRLPRDVKPYPGTPLLKGATTRIIYDVDRFQREGKPAYAATLARETHDADELGVPSKLQVSFSYSDGFGREIQKKIQAEPGSLLEDGPNVDPRWVGSGWTVFNNKGKPVRQYEPYFSDTHEFEFGKKVGVSPVLFYDPAERVVATLSPDNTYSKVVFNPWQQTTYDANDTVAANGTETGDPRTDADIKGYVEKYFASRPPLPAFKTWHEARISGALGPHEQKAAKQTEVHANTPSIVHLDTLGRPFLTVAHNKFQRTGASGDEQHETRVELDIEGNQREVKDAKGRIVMRYDYDMLGNKLHQDSMEAGRRRTLLDVVGKPMRAWDDRGFERRMEYDKLHRPTKLFVIAGGAKRLAEETVYGESKPTAESTYHRGKVWKMFDDAGVVENEKYDFKGNLLKSHREFRTEYKRSANWAPRPGVPVPEPLSGEKF